MVDFRRGHDLWCGRRAKQVRVGDRAVRACAYNAAGTRNTDRANATKDWSIHVDSELAQAETSIQAKMDNDSAGRRHTQFVAGKFRLPLAEQRRLSASNPFAGASEWDFQP